MAAVSGKGTVFLVAWTGWRLTNAEFLNYSSDRQER